jgi:hypothetical protein
MQSPECGCEERREPPETRELTKIFQICKRPRKDIATGEKVKKIEKWIGSKSWPSMVDNSEERRLIFLH